MSKKSLQIMRAAISIVPTIAIKEALFNVMVASMNVAFAVRNRLLALAVAAGYRTLSTRDATPVHAICTPIHKRMKAITRKIPCIVSGAIFWVIRMAYR